LLRSCAMMGAVMLVAFVVLGEVNGFMISLVQPEYIALNPGGSFTLTCGTDSHYEHCDWKHPGGSKVCNFEWKRNVGSVQMMECDGLIDRVSFAGDYNQHQCGITVTNAQMEDTGIWTCEVEQYVWGDWSRGTTVAATMNVSVVLSTTAPPSPATTVTSVSPTTNEAIVTSAGPTTTLTTPMTTQKQPPANSTSTAAVTEQTTTNKHQDSGGETEPEVEPEPSVVPQPVPQKEETEKSSSSTPVVVGVLVVLVVIGVLVGGVFYYRKRNAANGAVHYKPDPNDDKVTLNDSSNRESVVSVNSNLHEYYPPNLTYSSSTPDSNA